MHADATTRDTLSWEYDIPLVTSRFVLGDLARVTLLSIAIMWVLVALMGWFIDGEPVIMPWQLMAALTGGFFLLLVFSSLLLGNRVRATFTVSPDGVAYDSSRREKRINRIAALVGVLAGSPSAAGAGLLAMSSESNLYEWSDIKRVIYHAGPRVIVIRNSWRTLNRLYLSPDQYQPACDLVARYHSAGASLRVAEAAQAATSRPAWPVSLGLTALALVFGFCAHAWSWVDSEVATRAALFGTLLLVACAWLRGPLRRLLALGAVVGVGMHALDIVASALDPIDTWDGRIALTASLDTVFLVLAGVSTVLLLALGLWTLLGPERGGIGDGA